MKKNSILLLVPLLVCLLALTMGNALAQNPPTITELVRQSAADTGEFSTLLAALEASGLDEALDQPGTFTVFAPTNAAFEKLPEGLLEDLLADPEGLLTDILLYHVLGEVVFAEQIVGLDSATTLLGQDISIAVDAEGNVILNGSVKVIQTDIEASNGVVHVIDAVLVPQETPSAIDMASFDVSASGGRVTVAWMTATEFDNAGFNIHRGAGSDGPFAKVNADLIPAQGDEMFGGSYSFVDTPGRGIFYYRLEYVDVSGASDWLDLGLVETGPTIRSPLFRPNLPE
jgi:uncharacterized surface protein with fasciclin (FAS1) repeats